MVVERWTIGLESAQGFIDSIHTIAESGRRECHTSVTRHSANFFSNLNMAVEVGVWSCTVEPKKGSTVNPPAAIRITNVALGDVLADPSGRTTVKLTYGDNGAMDEEEPPKKSTFICALTPGKASYFCLVSPTLLTILLAQIEQVATNLVLEEDEEYVFEAVGKNTVYLTGNYIDQQGMDMPPFDDDSDDEEDAFNLEDVSSDVEMDPNDLDDEARRRKKKKKEAEKTDGETKKAAAEREVAGGVKIKDTKVGTGPAAKKGHTVSMRYIGKLQSGKIFDSNTKGKPFTFHLGKGEVIKGWDEGIVGMHVGGERLLTIPPAMGYGKRGTDGIPGNSTLIFEVKLTDLK
ncbi:Peptidylprolyl isomerase [Mycena sanguinolenta]|uniref:peptidylprolyl isomerase n=1 Tax=Mycena sanguinolenta TaxID=230812 RepID=A0A8H7DL14_9AGAR|nr:Peptidylprolyl isomerase [Mycena sanguinolenta]